MFVVINVLWPLYRCFLLGLELGPKPVPPLNLTALLVGRDVFLSWLPIIGSSVPVFWYKVEYSSVADDIWRRYGGPVQQSSVTETTVRGLAAGTYSFRVVAYGVMSFSEPSNTATVTVPPGE